MSKRKKDWKDIKIPKEVPPEALNGTGNKFLMDEAGLYSIQGTKVFSIFGEEYNNEINKEMERQYTRCPKCNIVPAKGGGCINHSDCPMKPKV